MDLSAAIKEWDACVSNFLVPLKTFQTIKEEWCEKVEEAALVIVKLMKNQDVISKRLVADFYAMPQIIRSEIPYREEKERLEKTASHIERCFHLILGNEIPGE